MMNSLHRANGHDVNAHGGDGHARDGSAAGPAILTDGLRVRRGKLDVLRDLSISVPPGQVVGLLGPSGSGKSTLMRSIVGAQLIAA